MLPSTIMLMAAITQALAIPTALTSTSAESQSIDSLTKRASPAPVSCGPSTDQRAWPLQSVQDNFNQLVALSAQGAARVVVDNNAGKPRAYPSFFTPSTDSVKDALAGIPECVMGQAGKSYVEFPITDPVLQPGTYPSKTQGKDRVLAIADGNDTPGTPWTNIVYCLAMTHRGQKGSQSGLCPPAP